MATTCTVYPKVYANRLCSGVFCYASMIPDFPHTLPAYTLIAKFMGPTWAHLGPTGPRWAPCWPHESCYLGMYVPDTGIIIWLHDPIAIVEATLANMAKWITLKNVKKTHNKARQNHMLVWPFNDVPMSCLWNVFDFQLIFLEPLVPVRYISPELRGAQPESLKINAYFSSHYGAMMSQLGPVFRYRAYKVSSGCSFTPISIQYDGHCVAFFENVFSLQWKRSYIVQSHRILSSGV